MVRWGEKDHPTSQNDSSGVVWRCRGGVGGAEAGWGQKNPQTSRNDSLGVRGAGGIGETEMAPNESNDSLGAVSV